MGVVRVAVVVVGMRVVVVVVGIGLERGEVQGKGRALTHGVGWQGPSTLLAMPLFLTPALSLAFPRMTWWTGLVRVCCCWGGRRWRGIGGWCGVQ